MAVKINAALNICVLVRMSLGAFIYALLMCIAPRLKFLGILVLIFYALVDTASFPKWLQ